MKKIMIIMTMMVIGFVGGANALPTVHKLGGSTTTVNKGTSNKGTDIVRSSKAISVKPIVSTNTTSGVVTTNSTDTTTARMPLMQKLSNYGTKKTSKVTTKVLETSDSVTSADLASVTDRVEVLEEKVETLPTEVVENGEGYYVTDVVKEGTNIKVTKSDTVYLPVKTIGGTRSVGQAEMWVE